VLPDAETVWYANLAPLLPLLVDLTEDANMGDFWRMLSVFESASMSTRVEDDYTSYTRLVLVESE
jgi:hypothetical protein